MKVTAVSSVALNVTGFTTGASLTGLTVKLIALVDVNAPSLTV